jgi:hypothetical protein
VARAGVIVPRCARIDPGASSVSDRPVEPASAPWSSARFDVTQISRAGATNRKRRVMGHVSAIGSAHTIWYLRSHGGVAWL